MAEYVSKEYLIKQFQGFSDKLKTIYEKQENIQFRVVDKYSDLTTPTVSTVCYVLNSETIGVDEFEKGFYLYDISQVTPLWTYVEMGGTSDFELDKWIANETHEVDKFYCYDYKLYKCIVTNTDSTFIEDNYELYVGKPTMPEWEAGKNYTTDDRFQHNGIIYQVIKDHTSTIFEDDTDNFIKIAKEYGYCTKEQYDYLINNGLNSNSMLYIVDGVTETETTISEWKENTEYNISDQVKYNDVTYECIIAHTSTTSFDDNKDNWIKVLDDEHYYCTYDQYTYLKTNLLLKEKLYIVDGV